MNTRFLLAASIATALAFVLPGTMADPDPRPACQGAVEAVGPLYIVYYPNDDSGEPQWIYVETNGLDGLQRGGTAVHQFGHDDCYERDANGAPTNNYDTALY